jgi:hypothetical protein
LGFYLGDDNNKEIKEKLPQLASVVSELMYGEGLEVDGVMYTFKVTFGGKHGNVGRAMCFLLILYALLNVFSNEMRIHLVARPSCS